MNKLIRVAITACVAVIFLSGCSQKTEPVSPGIDEPVIPKVVNSDDHHSLMGLWTIFCDPAENSVEIIPLRDADLHLNALKFLEPPALVYLKVEGQPQFNGNILDVDISLTNPYLGYDQFTGFDVCGILFTHGSVTGFHDPDIVLAGKGDARLLNADGYTRWWNPVEFPHVDTAFGYKDGLLGTPAADADFNCTINGYKYFTDGLDKDDPLQEADPKNRGMFGAGQKNVRHYEIDMGDELIFNYAVDANWMQPSGTPPYTVPDDFPPGANRPEAYNIVVTEVYNSLYYDESESAGGGNMKLRIDVWDHFSGSLNQVGGESLSGLPHNTMSAPIGGNDVYSTYELDIKGEFLIHNGEGELLITVQSEATGYGDNLPGEEICAYFIHGFDIATEPPAQMGWARTWGGVEEDRPNDVEIDSLGDLLVVGYFTNENVDFDPSNGEEIHSSNGEEDAFLSKYDNYGNFIWARTWGGIDYDEVAEVYIDSANDILVAGNFTGTVDLDPGPGVELIMSEAYSDCFLSKFDSQGNFAWAKTWGKNSGSINLQCIAGDDFDNIYLAGTMNSGVYDLDPGPGIDEHLSNGNDDVFFCKLDNEGNFEWAISWGGISSDRPYGLILDDWSNIYICGTYLKTVDFDPGPGIDEHISNGMSDAFLSKFDSNGIFQWAQVWGGTKKDGALCVATSADNSVYAGGAFKTTIDFDPGSEEDLHDSKGDFDSFITKFSSDGQYIWAGTWGSSSGSDRCFGILTRAGNIFATGPFGSIVDFDPSLNEDFHESSGWGDCYLSKFDSFGNFQWVRTWGGSSSDSLRSLASDDLGNMYFAGIFGGTADFNPGPGVDEHSSNGQVDSFLMKLLPNGYY